MGIQRPHGAVDDFYDIRLLYNDLLVIVKSSYLCVSKDRLYPSRVQGSFVNMALIRRARFERRKVARHCGWGKEDEKWWGKINSTINVWMLKKRLKHCREL